MGAISLLFSTRIGFNSEPLISVISPPKNGLVQSAVRPSLLGARLVSACNVLLRKRIPPALLRRISPEPAPPLAERVTASRLRPPWPACPRAARAMLPARLSLASARSSLVASRMAPPASITTLPLASASLIASAAIGGWPRWARSRRRGVKSWLASSSEAWITTSPAALRWIRGVVAATMMLTPPLNSAGILICFSRSKSIRL